MKGAFFQDDSRLQADLDQRLDVVTDPGFEDPAREDLGAADYIVIILMVVVTCVVAFWWGY